MKFVKLENKNVIVTDDSGFTLKLIQNIETRIELVNTGGVIIIQAGSPIFVFNVSDISSTQILPAAAIVFAGTASDLVNILAEDFFLAIDGGGGGLITGFATETTSIDVLNSLNNNSIIASLLQKIIEEQKTTNKLLNKIYQ
jgi:hypothetical protein